MYDVSETEWYADRELWVLETHERMSPVLANVQLQYHMAERLYRSIDKPRNLAKSVTVE